jgi:hypothetical protein
MSDNFFLSHNKAVMRYILEHEQAADLIGSECDIQDEIISIPMEDPLVHTPEHPYCGPDTNPDWATCPCQADRERDLREAWSVLADNDLRSERRAIGQEDYDEPGMRADFRRAEAMLPSYEQASEPTPTDDETDGQWVNGDEEDDETGTHPPDCDYYYCSAE